MRAIAEIWMLCCWLAWLIPFLVNMRRHRREKAPLTDRRANWGMVLQGVAYFIVWPPISPVPVSIIGSMIAAPLGVLLTAFAVPHLGKQWRIQAGLYADHQLVRSGPYAIVRHPIYCAMLLMFLSVALLHDGWLRFLIALPIFIAGLEVRIRTEDALLASRFPKEHEAYRKAVAAYIPFIR